MPQFLLLLAAGAGLYSGYKWISRELHRASSADEAAAEAQRRASGGGKGAPKDLGDLVWDEATGSYRPIK